MTGPLPRGLLPVVQTPFDPAGAVDFASLERLVEDAVAAGADGLLVPAVASEVASLTLPEREQVVRTVSATAAGRVPVIVGATADDAETCRTGAQLAEKVGACAYLLAVPETLLDHPAAATNFLADAAAGSPLPVMVQDLDWIGTGLPLDAYAELMERVPTLAGSKVETVPAARKFTALRDRFGDRLHISGGWAVPQLIEALDRGVDAIVPECAMLRVYRSVLDAYMAGDRDRAVTLFRRLLPILAYTNQELYTSIAFFKRLLHEKGVIDSNRLRPPGFAWDRYNLRIADELIAHYLELESDAA